MKLQDLTIDANKSLAGKKILTDISPVFIYKDRVRTDQIEGYNYEVVLPYKGFDKVKVKILGDKRLEMPKDYPEVEFENLSIQVFAFGASEPYIKVLADNIKVVKPAA